MKKSIFIAAALLVLATGGAFAQQINVGTYNLRYANHGDSVNGNGDLLQDE